MPEYFAFSLSFAIATYAAMVGMGGGSVLVPILMVVFHDRIEVVAATSLLVVFSASLSGSLANFRARRIDYVSTAVLLGPALIAGYFAPLATAHIPKIVFGPVFALALAAGGIKLLRHREQVSLADLDSSEATGETASPGFRRRIVDAEGRAYEYSYSAPVGMAVNAGIAFLSNLLGIGGGVLRVPAFMKLLRFPSGIATATSQFMILLVSAAGVVAHVRAGNVQAPALGGATGYVWLAAAAVLALSTVWRPRLVGAGPWLLGAFAAIAVAGLVLPVLTGAVGGTLAEHPLTIPLLVLGGILGGQVGARVGAEIHGATTITTGHWLRSKLGAPWLHASNVPVVLRPYLTAGTPQLLMQRILALGLVAMGMWGMYSTAAPAVLPQLR